MMESLGGSPPHHLLPVHLPYGQAQCLCGWVKMCVERLHKMMLASLFVVKESAKRKVAGEPTTVKFWLGLTAAGKTKISLSVCCLSLCWHVRLHTLDCSSTGSVSSGAVLGAARSGQEQGDEPCGLQLATQLVSVQSLGQQGADFNQAAAGCMTPLFIATSQGHIAVANYLREQGAI
jgi:hypothetical protein